MKDKSRKIQHICIVIVLLLTCCRPISKTATSTTSIHSKPPIVGETIGHNETLATGTLILDNKIEYFVIDSIHKRGNTAAVINIGSKLRISEFSKTKPAYNKMIRGILINKRAKQGYLWVFRELN